MGENKKKPVMLSTVRPPDNGIFYQLNWWKISPGIEPPFQEYYIRKPKIKP